jgi:Preprotein translocase subunit SecD
MISACASRPGAPAPATRKQVPLRVADVDFVQFRWEDPGARSSARYVDPASGQTVALNDSVVLDIRGIDSAWTWHSQRDTVQWDVVLLLSRSGAAQFGATTATHVGQRLAIVVDSTITEMPVIMGALGPHAPLASNVPRSVADSLAVRVNRAVEALRPYHPLAFPRDRIGHDARLP